MALPANSFKLDPYWSGQSYLAFFDEKYGWLELQRASSSNFKDGMLFATQNGGASWSQLPFPPIVDRMAFISPTVGWIAGGPGGERLYRTNDGGQAWQGQIPPLPSQVAQGNTPQYAPPRFSNPNDGLLPVTYLGSKLDPNVSVFVVYRSTDRGNNWKQERIEVVPIMEAVPSSAYDSTVIRAFTARNSFTIGSHTVRPPVITPPGSPDLYITDISFADQFNGWLVTSGGSCTNGKNCKTATRLFATSNGGKSLTDITPSEKQKH